jgi:hypothetical protein
VLRDDGGLFVGQRGNADVATFTGDCHPALTGRNGRSDAEPRPRAEDAHCGPGKRPAAADAHAVGVVAEAWQCMRQRLEIVQQAQLADRQQLTERLVAETPVDVGHDDFVAGERRRDSERGPVGARHLRDELLQDEFEAREIPVAVGLGARDAPGRIDESETGVGRADVCDEVHGLWLNRSAGAAQRPHHSAARSAQAFRSGMRSLSSCVIMSFSISFRFFRRFNMI